MLKCVAFSEDRKSVNIFEHVNIFDHLSTHLASAIFLRKKIWIFLFVNLFFQEQEKVSKHVNMGIFVHSFDVNTFDHRLFSLFWRLPWKPSCRRSILDEYKYRSGRDRRSNRYRNPSHIQPLFCALPHIPDIFHQNFHQSW